jgi:hypothetical protein
MIKLFSTFRYTQEVPCAPGIYRVIPRDSRLKQQSTVVVLFHFHGQSYVWPVGAAPKRFLYDARECIFSQPLAINYPLTNCRGRFTKVGDISNA